MEKESTISSEGIFSNGLGRKFRFVVTVLKLKNILMRFKEMGFSTEEEHCREINRLEECSIKI